MENNKKKSLEKNDEIKQYNFTKTSELVWKKFETGNLRDISLYLTEYYASIVFKNGDIDSHIFSDAIFNNLSDKTIVFDVGAFVGADSLVFAKKIGEKGKVIAFEPNVYNRERLLLNLSHNSSLSRKINVFPYALGEAPGKIRMNISSNIDNGHSSTSRILNAHSKIDNSLLPEGFFETNVDVITLDEFVEKNGIIPNIIKVDIEGAEHLMLAGAMETMEKYKPVVYMEIHSEYCALTCYKLFESLKYSVSIIHEEDDNRLMIKATYADNKKITTNDLMIEAQRNLNSSFEIMRNANLMSQRIIETNSKLKIINAELQDENNELVNTCEQLREESKKLQVENEKTKSEYDKLLTANNQLNLLHKKLSNCRAVRFENIIKKYAKKAGIMKF